MIYLGVIVFPRERDVLPCTKLHAQRSTLCRCSIRRSVPPAVPAVLSRPADRVLACHSNPAHQESHPGTALLKPPIIARYFFDDFAASTGPRRDHAAGAASSREPRLFGARVSHARAGRDGRLAAAILRSTRNPPIKAVALYTAARTRPALKHPPAGAACYIVPHARSHPALTWHAMRLMHS